MKKRVAFVTCVQIGLSCLEEIASIGAKIDLLITLKDSIAKTKSGRIYLDSFSAKYNIPLLKIKNINEEAIVSKLKEMNIDWLFIIGWSQIAKQKLLNTPNLGCIGMHPTLLPIGRGRAAIPWAIIKGLDKTGVTMFKLDEGVDTGPIIGQEEIPVNNKTTATVLYEAVNKAHVNLVAKYLDSIVNSNVKLTPQDESRATEWLGRRPEDGKIVSTMTTCEAERLVRAVTKPYPGAYYIEDKKLFRIWSAVPNETSGHIKLKDGYLEFLDFEIEEFYES